MEKWVKLIHTSEGRPDPDEAFTNTSKRWILGLYESTEWFTQSAYRGLTSDMIRKAEGILSDLGEYEGEVIGWENAPPRPTGWTIDSVEVFGEKRKATSGGGVPMVEVTNYKQRFSGLYDPDGGNLCLKCGRTFKGSAIAQHIAEGTGHPDDGRHKIKRREVAAAVILPKSSGVSEDEAHSCLKEHQGTQICDCGGHRYDELSGEAGAEINPHSAND
jgi:hypothetical protein